MQSSEVGKWVLAMPAALMLHASAAQAGGAEIAAEYCSACHGAGGVSLNPLVPILAGQPYTLIEDNLLAFRAGKRVCSAGSADGSPSAALAQTMCTLVAGLSEEEIASLAAYLSSQAFVPAEQAYDPERAVHGFELHERLGCDRCHADGGRETLGMAPVLAGQWMPFLRRALQRVKNGDRSGPKTMNPAIRALGDDEIQALLDFYASRPRPTPP